MPFNNVPDSDEPVAEVLITSTTDDVRQVLYVEPRGSIHIDVVNGDRTTGISLRFSRGGKLSLSRLASRRTDR